jgi:hypothetical protein
MNKSLVIFLFVLAAVFIPLNQALLHAHGAVYPLESTETFDAEIRTNYRAAINRENPGIVAIGDSAIRELDQESFSRELGRKTLIFSTPGSGSAYWYLFFRHQILEAEEPPEIVLIFFRSLTLTEPAYLVNGDYRTRLEEVAATGDADVYALSIGKQLNPLVKIAERYIPLFAYRSTLYQNWVTVVRNWLPEVLFDCGNACVDEAFDQVFDDAQINAYLWEELIRNLDNSLNKEENFNFQMNVADSLLPLMLKDARTAGIIPVFVRLQYRSQAAGEADSPEMSAYLQDLQHYVQQNGGLFIDLAGVAGLTADMYRDEIHLKDEDATAASEIIAQAIRRHLDFLPGR